MKMPFGSLVLSTKSIAKRFPALSRRELEVCGLVIRRLSTCEIAACLSKSQRTIEKHVEHIFKKLGVHSREQLRDRLGVLPFSSADQQGAVRDQN